MENKPTVIQTGLKYGLIAGVVSIIYSAVLFITGEFLNMWIGFIGFIFLILLLILGMKEYRKEHDGFMEYKEGLGLGTLIVAVSSILSQIFTYIYINFIDTTLVTAIADKTQEMMEKFVSDEAVIEKAVADAQERITSPMSILTGILWAVVIGFIISLIVAAIMQRKRSELDTIDAR